VLLLKALGGGWDWSSPAVQSKSKLKDIIAP